MVVAQNGDGKAGPGREGLLASQAIARQERNSFLSIPPKAQLFVRAVRSRKHSLHTWLTQFGTRKNSTLVATGEIGIVPSSRSFSFSPRCPYSSFLSTLLHTTLDRCQTLCHAVSVRLQPPSSEERIDLTATASQTSPRMGSLSLSLLGGCLCCVYLPLCECVRVYWWCFLMVRHV